MRHILGIKSRCKHVCFTHCSCTKPEGNFTQRFSLHLCFDCYPSDVKVFIFGIRLVIRKFWIWKHCGFSYYRYPTYYYNIHGKRVKAQAHCVFSHPISSPHDALLQSDCNEDVHFLTMRNSLFLHISQTQLSKKFCTLMRVIILLQSLIRHIKDHYSGNTHRHTQDGNKHTQNSWISL